MDNIPSAFRVMDTIFAQINLQRERDAVAAVNKQRRRTTSGACHSTLRSGGGRTGPARAVAVGGGGAGAQGRAEAVVEAERVARGVASGTVLEQTPEPGTSAVADGEVRVVLRGRRTGGGAVSERAAVDDTTARWFARSLAVGAEDAAQPAGEAA